MFLIKAGLGKEEFVGTNVVSAVIVDTGRLLVYGFGFYSIRSAMISDAGGLVAAATASAFMGAFIGRKILGKITLRTVQVIVAVMLVALGIALGSGLV